MARKKKEPELKKNIDTAHVEGLRAEVLEQPITDTLDRQLYALRDERHRLARHPGDRRLQAVTPEAAVHDVQNGPAERRADQIRQHRRTDHAPEPARRRRHLRDHGPSGARQRGPAAPRSSTPRATSARSIPAIWPTPPRAIPRRSSTPSAPSCSAISTARPSILWTTTTTPCWSRPCCRQRFRTFSSRPTWASPSAWPATSARFNLREVCKTTIALDRESGMRPALGHARAGLLHGRRAAV